MPAVSVAAGYAAQNQTDSGVRVSCMMVLAVSLLSFWHFRQRRTVGRLAKRHGSPGSPHQPQTKPLRQRMASKYRAQARSSGKRRWNSGSEPGNGRLSPAQAVDMGGVSF